jgi:hypothetical protein
MFNFYDIKTNGITLLIINSPMMNPCLISLHSISEGFCTSEHSQVFLRSQKTSHPQLSLLLTFQSKSTSVERPRAQPELNSVLRSRRFPSARSRTE